MRAGTGAGWLRRVSALAFLCGALVPEGQAALSVADPAGDQVPYPDAYDVLGFGTAGNGTAFRVWVTLAAPPSVPGALTVVEFSAGPWRYHVLCDVGPLASGAGVACRIEAFPDDGASHATVPTVVPGMLVGGNVTAVVPYAAVAGRAGLALRNLTAYTQVDAMVHGNGGAAMVPDSAATHATDVLPGPAATPPATDPQAGSAASVARAAGAPAAAPTLAIVALAAVAWWTRRT